MQLVFPLLLVGLIVILGFSAFVIISPPPLTCQEKWVCSAWSSCSGGIQTRSCTDQNACGTEVKKPLLSRECQPLAGFCGDSFCTEEEICSTCPQDCGSCPTGCIESWSCSSWGSCQGGIQARTCTDQNSCGTTAHKPPESQGCTMLDALPPTLTSFSLTVGNGQVTISYSATDSSLPLSYRVVRSTSHSLVDNLALSGPNSFDSLPPGAALVVSGTAPGPYTDSPLTNGIQYYYRIRVCDSAPISNCLSSSPPSPSATPSASQPDNTPSVTLTSPPDRATSQSTSVDFTAQASDDSMLANATLYHNLSGSFAPGQTLSLSGTSQIVQFSLTIPNNTQILWNVRACDSLGQCAFAGLNYTVKVLLSSLPQDNPPSSQLNSPLSGATSSTTSILFNATAMDDVQLRNATLYHNASGTFKANQTVPLGGTRQDALFTLDIPDQIGVVWNVRACDSLGQCRSSSTNFTLTIAVPLPDTSPPTVILQQPADNAANQPTSITFTAQASDTFQLASATLYHNASGTFLPNQTLPLSGVSAPVQFTVTFQPGESIKWNIRACDSSGNCQSAQVDRTLFIAPAPDTQPPTAPSLSASSLSPSSIRLTWTAATDNIGVTGYRVDISTSSTFLTFVPGWNSNNIGNMLTIDATGLSPSTTYYARVRAYDAAGNIGPNSNPASATTSSPPDTQPPVETSFFLVGGDQDITIYYSFIDNSPPIRYTIIRGTNQVTVDSVPVGSFGFPTPGVTIVMPSTPYTGNPPPFTDTGVVDGVTYYYRIQACDTPGNCAATISKPAATTYCGDGTCNGPETCSSCSGDCGLCPDSAPPAINSFLATPADSQVTIQYQATDPSPPSNPLLYTVARGTNLAIINSLTISRFGNPPAGVTLVIQNSLNSGIPGSFLDVVDNDITYYYRMRACDSATPQNCILSVVHSALPVGPHLSFTVTGPPYTVFDYTNHKCNTMDLPDVFAHAIRNSNNEIVLANGNDPNLYFMFGPDFNSLTRDCTPVMTSSASSKFPASSFNHNEWITSVYTLDGQTIYGLVSNEYHDTDPTHNPPCNPSIPDPGNPCWYNSITSAVSTNGGRAFTQAAAPAHLVAAVNSIWSHTPVTNPNPPPATLAPVYGYLAPTNILKKTEGGTDYYYALFPSIASKEFTNANRGTCVMRTATLGNPASWRAWDGQGFNLPMPSPYLSPGLSSCTFVSKQNIDDLGGSLTYNTLVNKYLLVGAANLFDPADGQQKCADWYSLSKDLIHWDRARVLKLIPSNTCGGNPIGSEIYPSLIDHTFDQSGVVNNFEKVGSTPHLYYVTYVNPNNYLDRDMKRVPLQIQVI